MSVTLLFCNSSLSPVRSEPKDSSEMVTQLLFGETVELLQLDRQWRKIKSLTDHYEGWVDEKMISELSQDELKTWHKNRSVLFEDVAFIDSQNGPIPLTKGAYIEHKGINDSFYIGEHKYTFQANLKQTPKILKDIVLSYRNAPYLWGGKSLLGIDCSGLTQMVYRFISFELPRDAYQQAELGKEVSLSESKPGDLAFFDNEAGKITHVGIVLKGNKIIHAHGQVIINDLNEKGIYNQQKDYHSHKLCVIKRYF